MPYSDEELLKYAGQFQQEEPTKEKGKDKEEDELLEYAQTVTKSSQPYDPRLTPEENQAAWQMSIAKSPTVAGGLKSWGARAISGVYRAGELLPGKAGKYAQEHADWFANYSTALQRAAEIAGDQGIVKKGLTGALSSAPTAIVAAPLGGAAMISAAMLDTANQSITEGRNAGLKGAELGAYTARQGVAEGAISGLLLKVGLGGIEKTLPGAWTAAKQGIRQGIASSWGQIAKQTGKAIAKTYGEELLDEVPTNVLQMLNDKYSGVDKSKLTIRQVYEDAKLTAAVTAWSVLGGTGPAHLAQNMKLQKTAKLFNDVVNAANEGKTPSRRQWKEWGFDPKQGDTQEQRAEGLQEAAEAIREQESVVEPEQAQSQQEGVQGPVEPTIPEEVLPKQSPGEIVLSGIKNDLINEARAARGEAELTQPALKKWEKSLEEAKNEIVKTPLMPVELVEELNKSPRPVTDVESAALNIHYKGLKDCLGLAYQHRDAAIKSNDSGVIDRTQKQADIMLEQVRQVEEASKNAGTETARSLVSRKILLKEDYSIGNLLSRASIAKGNKSLTALESGKVRELNLKIEQLQKQLDAQTIYSAEEKQATAIEAQIESAKPKKSFRKSPEKVAAAKQDVKDAVANFKQVLAGKPVESFITEEKGALDLEVVAAGYQVAKAYANLGYTTFTEFFYGPAKSILGSQADALKSHLYEAWQQLKTGGKVRPLTISRDDPNSIIRESRKLLTSLVKSGTVDRNVIINQVHSEFQEVIPDITRREVMDAISGYGQFSKLSKSELAARMRDLRGQMRRVAKIEDLEAGLPTKKTGFEQRELSKEEQDLVQQIKDVKERLGLTRGEKLAAYKKRLQSRIEEYKQRIKEGDYSKQLRQETILDKEALKTKYQLTQAKNEFKALEDKLIRSRRTVLRKAWDIVPESLNASRAILTSTDLSAVFRQGAFVAFAHPVLAAKAVPEMLKAFVSSENAFEAAAKLRERENYGLYLKSKLAITATEGPLTLQEEAFMGRWASMFPVVAGSERAYVTFLNRMRADVFDSLAATLAINGKPTDVEAKAIANFVNVATGRGSMGMFEPAAIPLATVFFAPKFVLSRFQLLVGQPAWSGTMDTRKMVAKEYARALTGVGTFYAVYMLMHALFYPDDEQPTIEIDPRSSDFCKIKHGNTRLDPLGGLSQVAVFTTRMFSGETKTAKGYIRPLRDILTPTTNKKVKFGGSTIGDVAWRFIRGKFSPWITNVFDILSGENVIGEPITPESVAKNVTIPLAARDVYEALQDEHLGRGVADSLLAILGMGVQNYNNTKRKR